MGGGGERVGEVGAGKGSMGGGGLSSVSLIIKKIRHVTGSYPALFMEWGALSGYRFWAVPR